MDYTKLEKTRLGRYTLDRLMYDSGGIVVTYRAYQTTLSRDVAIQILNPQHEKWDQLRPGFLRAAELMAQLEHPNIAPIHDYGTQGDLDFIVMRLIEGQFLRECLTDQVPISLSGAASIIKQIGSALDYVHSRGRVHGDPSWNNIMLDVAGNAYIADFHIAGFRSAAGDMEGWLTGTPIYLAPERWIEGAATPASDQYALGAIAYHLVAGRPPFVAADGALAIQHLQQDVKLPQQHNPELPQAVNAVLLRALAKKPEDRYPTVMDFSREFEKSLSAAPQHLFISYSRRDSDYAQSLTDYLQNSGFNVWIDSQIEYGDAWFRDIEQAIKSCAAFVLVMTPDSYESEWVQKEILLAKRFKKPIFPLLLKGEEFGIVIDIQFADVRDAQMPTVDFHRRLRRTVFGDI